MVDYHVTSLPHLPYLSTTDSAHSQNSIPYPVTHGYLPTLYDCMIAGE